jgi:hypothetical protein
MNGTGNPTYVYTCCFSSKDVIHLNTLYLVTNSIGTACGDVSDINVLVGDKLSNATAYYTCYVNGVCKASNCKLTFV